MSQISLRFIASLHEDFSVGSQDLWKINTKFPSTKICYLSSSLSFKEDRGRIGSFKDCEK